MPGWPLWVRRRGDHGVRRAGEAQDAAAAAEAARVLQDFDGAVRATERAWQQTSLLAMSRHDTVNDAMATLREGDAARLGAMLTRMGHESFLAAVPYVPGLEADKAARLSGIVVALLARDLADAHPAPREPQQAAEALLALARGWIEAGRGHPELQSIAQLVGSCGVRAALAAPLAPACATLRAIARARSQGFSFRAATAAAA